MKWPLTKALMQEALDRAYLFRRRAALRHGLAGPDEERNVIGDPEEPKPQPPPPTTPPPVVPPPVVPPPRPVVIVPPGESKMPGWAKIGLGMAIAGPIAAGATWLAANRSSSNTTTINNPPPVSSSNGGDLLNWLDQEGYDERR